MSSFEYKIKVVTENDRNKIVDFVEEFFTKDEPLNKSLNITTLLNNSAYFLQGINQNCCFKAVNENDEIIGVILSSVISAEIDQIKLDGSNEKMAKICNLMKHVANESKIFEKYPKYLDGKIVCVHRDYGRRGIAGGLLQKSKEYMLQNNIPAMIRVCTSEFSAKVMKKSGMNEVHTLFYDQYKNKNGDIVFKPENPHVAVRTMVLDIKLN